MLRFSRYRLPLPLPLSTTTIKSKTTMKSTTIMKSLLSTTIMKPQASLPSSSSLTTRKSVSSSTTTSIKSQSSLILQLLSSSYVSNIIKIDNQKNHNNNYLISLLLISSLSLLYYNYKTSCDSDNEDDKKLSKEQLINELKQRLDIVRLKLSKQYSNLIKPSSFPMMNVQFHGSNTYALELILNKQYDIIPLISKWTSVLNDTINSQNMNLNLSTNTSSNKNMNFMSIISNDKKSSISIRSKVEADNIAVSIYKDGGFTNNDVNFLIEGYYSALLPFQNNDSNIIFKQPSDSVGNGTTFKFQNNSSNDDPISKLQGLGVEVFDKSANAEINWDSLAGYDNIKKDMDETVVSALKFPEIYDDVARKTRKVFETNRPKAILLEGPPGTGKTLTARILASQCDRPLIVLKLDNVVSKWYGESEKKLSKILDLCDSIEGGSIIFIDEVDAFAGNRDAENMHEVSRRVLSIILQHTEGFKGKKNTVLICATNRKSDLDSALLSRFDLSIRYENPDHNTRKQIISRYAKQFENDNKSLTLLADESNGLSCRDIKDSCQQSERQFASKILKKEKLVGSTPSLEDYRKCFKQRKDTKKIDDDLAHV